MLKQASSALLGALSDNPAANPMGMVRRASAALTSAPGSMARRASNAVVAIKDVMMPSQEIGLDVLGLAIDDEDGSFSSAKGRTSAFEADDMFEVDDIEDENGNLTPMIVSAELTSRVFIEDDSTPLGWECELLLLTHEPLRRDMLEMQRALQARYMGDFPEGWRVRAFFRFFTGWASLVSQAHAVEVTVHYDWLCANSNAITGEQRQELLSYHRAIELELLAISKMEKKILDELKEFGAGESEPFSEVTVMLRDRMQKLCRQIRLHLATSEAKLPEVLRAQWGRVSPPELVVRALEAGKRAQVSASKVGANLLPWVMHYLNRRDPARGKKVIAQLPFMKRMKYAVGWKQTPHSTLLEHLRCIITDDEAKARIEEKEPAAAADGEAVESSQEEHEKQRRAGMVNAVLAAANARRVDAPVSSQNAELYGKLAGSDGPLHQFKMDDNWTKKTTQIPDNIYKKVGIDKPLEAPRRL